MKVQLIAHTPDPDKLIAAAAKLCYSAVGTDQIMEGLTEDKTEKFIDMLSSLGHESPVEHATFTFAVEGVSRSLLAQLTRHRIASFSVQSQRYVDKENFEYVIPPEIDCVPEARALFIKAMDADRETYKELNRILTEKHTQTNLDAGMDENKAKTTAAKKAQEDARYVLSNACDTKIVMTFNVRSLYNFFSLRCCSRAQWEIREMACEMLRLVKEVSPALFKNAGPSCVRGKCAEGAFTCGRALEVREIIRNGGKV